MSQHIFKLDHPKHGRIEVLAGWDRPLQGYFLSIERLDAPEEDDDVYVYSNLDDATLLNGGFAESFSYFVAVLARLGIALPAQMVADIMEDGRENRGNKQRDWNEYRAGAA